MKIALVISRDDAQHVAQALRRAVSGEVATTAEQSAVKRLLNAISAELGEPERPTRSHAGHIDWTLEDESYEPNGRQFDVRVYYDWIEAEPGDSVTPAFGGYAEVAEVEILGVRHFDDLGNEIPLAEYHRDAAWKLIAHEASAIEAACTRNGNLAAKLAPGGLPLRAAPSVRQRVTMPRRALG